MRRRRAAKLIVLDPDNRVLLFRFRFEEGPLAGEEGWCAPGGGLEPGETFEAAARRELKEETGIVADVAGPHVAEREFAMRLPDGEPVIAEERYFIVRSAGQSIDRSGWTALERDTMVEHRWWSVAELMATKAVVFPEGLAELLAKVDRDRSAPEYGRC
jgi:8-oxo-dGTP pyrophosphatase MutT (NUDIX family)